MLIAYSYTAEYSYFYDYENRLTKIQKPGEPDVDVAVYTYDALGRRIEVEDAVAGVTTRYYYDNDRVLLETDWDDGNEIEADERYYVFGNYIDEVLLMTDNLADTPVDHYYGHDHLFSPVILFDDDDSVLERYEYDAYGRSYFYNHDFSQDYTSSQQGNSYLFTGRKLDILDGVSLKINYYRARYYDPNTGRFLSRDPLGYIDGMNLYEYVRSNPIKFLDYSGLACSYAIGLCKRNVSGIKSPEYIWVMLPGALSPKKVKVPKRIQDKVNHLIPDHHDVRIITYAGKKCTGRILSQNTRGFSANNFNDAIKEYILSKLGLSSGWVPGSAGNSGLPTKCEMKCVSEEGYKRVKKKMGGFNPKYYNLGEFNCQHWAGFVLR